MIGNLWPVFAAMDGVASTDGTTRKDGIDEFPDESPTDKQMSDWLDAVDPFITSRFGAALRDETPSHLKQYAGVDDLTGFTILPDTVTGMRPDQIQSHNYKVRQAMAAKQLKRDALAEGLRDQHGRRGGTG